MTKTVYSEKRMLTYDFLDAVINRDIIKHDSFRNMVHHIIDNLPFEDLERLGFVMEEIDPNSDESIMKLCDDKVPQYEKDHLSRLGHIRAIELNVSIIL